MRETIAHAETPIIGISDAFHELLEASSSLASLDRPVLIVGERGTGKELIAARLHYLSERWDKPYVKLNCATLSENLLESELFGYEPGAFTGAQRVHKGRFERAHQGSLFLDELAAMSLRLQEKVLRTIEYGELERLGGNRTLQVQTRIIAATNEDLPAKAAQGLFRADLLDRLSFEVLTLPPLRVRQEDIMLLAEHFAVKMTHELQRDFFAGFSDPARNTLLSYDWPGNVRELKNVIERSVYRQNDPRQPLECVLIDPFASPYRPLPKRSALVDQVAAIPAVAVSNELGFEAGEPTSQSFADRVRQCEIRLLREGLLCHQFNQRKTASALGLSYHQLRGLLRKHKIATGQCDTPR